MSLTHYVLACLALGTLAMVAVVLGWRGIKELATWKAPVDVTIRREVTIGRGSENEEQVSLSTLPAETQAGLSASGGFLDTSKDLEWVQEEIRKDAVEPEFKRPVDIGTTAWPTDDAHPHRKAYLEATKWRKAAARSYGPQEVEGWERLAWMAVGNDPEHRDHVPLVRYGIGTARCSCGKLLVVEVPR